MKCTDICKPLASSKSDHNVHFIEIFVKIFDEKIHFHAIARKRLCISSKKRRVLSFFELKKSNLL